MYTEYRSLPTSKLFIGADEQIKTNYVSEV